MKLADFAKQQGVRYETAWRWFRDGKIKGRRVGAHTILVEEASLPPPRTNQRVAVYARVSSTEHKANLDSQTERLLAYCSAKGYQVATVVKEIGSGINDAHPKLLALLEDMSIHLLVLEHKDRLSRFGTRYIETLLSVQGRRLEIVNEAANDKEDLLADFTAIFSSFTARLYGLRRAQRKTEQIVQALEAEHATR